MEKDTVILGSTTENDAVIELPEFDNPPDPERVIEGLRDTGYDFNTAIADIVDNSISANATRIDINVNMDPQCNVTVYIADNGVGMTLPELKNAMKYGSDRRPDPKSLGKFGLGLKTASTSFCRKLSLVSKGSDNTTRKVQWDLSYVAVAGWKVKNLKPNDDELDLLDATTDGGTGTLVVWEENDRLLKRAYSNPTAAKKALNKMLDDPNNGLRFHLSAVYQRFLDPAFADAPNITITLNGEKVLPWDPFCIGEPLTELLADKNVEVEMPDGTPAFFRLRAYAIPRSKTYSSTSAEKTARISTDTMGFYIYRENRLIHYGDWLNMFVKDPHDSLLRVDFSFTHELDDAFNVDIKKSRVQLNEQIFIYIKDRFIPAPKRAANEKYRTGVDKAIATKSQNAHTESNRNIEQKAAGLEESRVTVTNPDTGEVIVENAQGAFKHTITVKGSESPDECRVVAADSLPGGGLWEPAIIDGKHAVRINKSHPYYQKIYYPVLSQSVLVTGMDALLWALAETELSTYNRDNQEQFEDIRYRVSRALKKLVDDLPDPEIREDN